MSTRNYIVVFSIFVTIFTYIASSLAIEPIPIEQSSPPLFSEFDADAKAVENISGVTCFDTVNCLAVSDEMVAIQLFKLKEEGGVYKMMAGQELGSAFGNLCRDIAEEDDCEEVDLEAVTSVGRETFITGSMGNKKKSGKVDEARWFVSKIIMNGAFNSPSVDIQFAKGSEKFRGIFKSHNKIQPYIQKALQCYGLNIEGFARIENTGYLGLRSPVGKEKGQAFIVSTDVQSLVSNSAAVSASKIHLLEFIDDSKKIRDVGIRALEEFGDRLLIVTGDQGVAKPKKFKNWQRIVEKCDGVLDKNEQLNIVFGKKAKSRIWIWDPNHDNPPKHVVTIDGQYERQKLEGIAVMSKNVSSADLLLAFDDAEGVEPLAVLRNLHIPD